MIIWHVDDTVLLTPFRTDISDLLTADPATWVVTFGLRTFAEQDALYAKGRDAAGNVVDKSAVVTEARGGQSPHNFGLAVDLTLVKNKKDDWAYDTDPDWQRLYDKVDAHPRLHAGIHFSNPDGDHIEAVHWRSLIPQEVSA